MLNKHGKQWQMDRRGKKFCKSVGDECKTLNGDEVCDQQCVDKLEGFSCSTAPLWDGVNGPFW